MKTIKTIAVFFTLIRLIWLAATSIAATNATIKSLVNEQNIGDLANKVAALAGGTFTGGISLGGDLNLNGHNITNVSEINLGGQAAGFHGDVFTNGKSIFLGGGSGHAQGGTWGT